ncbi:MAG TPA: MinD/ParA family protein [Candidatus Sulfomarinibacteraceae bacterium]|nr:MinD/ParA family protein [Candidatus Sulfomarinibacteraceae bacterium]
MCKIISIHSFRGGTGKSNLTANIAALLALQGHRVGVVDTDIQCPGIHVLFGLDAQKMGYTLNHYLRGECAIEDVAFAVGRDAGGAPGRRKLQQQPLWLIPSSIEVGEISDILRNGYDVNRLNEGLQKVRKTLDLDYLFIDTHPGLNDETLLSIAFSDVLLVLLRLDQQDFQGTAVTVDIARSLDVPNLFLVVNKALSHYDFGQIEQRVADTYGVPVAGVLPLSEAMVDLQSADIFALRHPNHAWSQGVRGVVDHLLTVE